MVPVRIPYSFTFKFTSIVISTELLMTSLITQNEYSSFSQILFSNLTLRANMGKISVADKIQTLSEQGLWAKTIVKAFPEKEWKLSSVRTICQCTDKTRSAIKKCSYRRDRNAKN